jgi:hypothetical protein
MTSYFQDIEHHIVRKIRLAHSRLLIAVAWFSNSRIGDEIIKKKGLDIEIVIDDNTINRNCRNLSSLHENGIDVTFIKDLTKNYYLMHNKFCVIDSRLVITGSYNWTYNANSNDENITILTDQVNAIYTHEFRRIKNLKFPSDGIFMLTEDIDDITNQIHLAFISLLKANIDSLQRGLFFKWSNENIKNRIRTIDEGLRNNILKKIGSSGIYEELIAKYGFQFNSLASDDEKVTARDKFNKKGLDEIDHYLYKEFQFFKLKAIKKLQDNYAKLLANSDNEQDKMERVFKVFKFIAKEKLDIATDIHITTV